MFSDGGAQSPTRFLSVFARFPSCVPLSNVVLLCARCFRSCGLGAFDPVPFSESRSNDPKPRSVCSAFVVSQCCAQMGESVLTDASGAKCRVEVKELEAKTTVGMMPLTSQVKPQRALRKIDAFEPYEALAPGFRVSNSGLWSRLYRVQTHSAFHVGTCRMQRAFVRITETHRHKHIHSRADRC